MTSPTGPAPPSAWPSRPLAGVCMHFTSLPSPHGIGDIGDASRNIVDELADMGLRVWQMLPAGPAGYGDSPYQPLSAFAGNELLIGLEPLLRQGLLRETEVSALRALPADEVDYGALIPLKQAALKRAAERFLAANGPDREAYEAFLEDHDEAWLHDYAIFRVLKTLHEERPWPEWDSDFARRLRPALRKIEAAHRPALERIKAMQFFFERQLAELRRHARERGVRLFGDLPFYIALDSADAWSARESFLLDANGRPSQVAGVPPDYFSENGQLWGNPLYDWTHLGTTGYGWWIARLKHVSSHCDMVRVDHFRGFESFWSVPFGETTARNGRWLPGPGDALFDAARRALGDLPLLAENLGVITEAVEGLRRRHGIPGMKVLQFELGDADFEPGAVPEDCMCYTGTHDNDTTPGWFSGKGRGKRGRGEFQQTRRNALRLTGGTPKTIHRDLVRLAFWTRARIAAAPMQDYLGLGSAARLNTPGTKSGNWRWRMTPGQLSARLMGEIAELVTRSGRA